MDLTPYLELVGLKTKRRIDKEPRRQIHLTRSGVPHTPQVFTPEEGGVSPGP